MPLKCIHGVHVSHLILLWISILNQWMCLTDCVHICLSISLSACVCSDDDNRIPLQPLSESKDCQGDYINACYIDVSRSPYKLLHSLENWNISSFTGILHSQQVHRYSRSVEYAGNKYTTNSISMAPSLCTYQNLICVFSGHIITGTWLIFTLKTTHTCAFGPVFV